MLLHKQLQWAGSLINLHSLSLSWWQAGGVHLQFLFHCVSAERAAFHSAAPDPGCSLCSVIMATSMSAFSGSPRRSTRVVFQHFHSPHKTCQHLQHPSSFNTLPMENNLCQSTHILPSGLLGTLLQLSLCQALSPSLLCRLPFKQQRGFKTHPAVTSPWRWEVEIKG